MNSQLLPFLFICEKADLTDEVVEKGLTGANLTTSVDSDNCGCSRLSYPYNVAEAARHFGLNRTQLHIDFRSTAYPDWRSTQDLLHKTAP